MIDLKKYEKELYQNNIKYIGGVDEVGRGPLVGPVVSACVVLPIDFELEGLTDSKQLSEKKRNLFFDVIMEKALGVGIGMATNDEIDEINILNASKLSMKRAIEQVKCPIEHLLIDAVKLDVNIPSTSIIKGDALSISIAAASVIAKVTRDRMMIELDKKYPQYGYAKHKGYPTKYHLEMIEKYGLIEGYRKSYKPVANIINQKEAV